MNDESGSVIGMLSSSEYLLVEKNALEHYPMK
jgi:hypothetical protein